MMRPAFTHTIVLVSLAACGDNGVGAGVVDAHTGGSEQAIDAAPDADTTKPTHLAETGLCVDAACTQITPGLVEYTPRFPLFADTASKRRWIYMPPGATIDTSDMDHWMFPQGFKIWKEFTRGPTRIETRLIAKIGPGDDLADWYYMAYQWNATEDDAVAVPAGVIDANGTPHNIPSVSDCRACHEKLAPSRVLGFQAIQLDGATPVGIDEVAQLGWLSAPPSGTSPHFPLPGTATEKAALGYLHANCSHCHNATGVSSTPLHMRLEVGHLATTAATDTYKTAIDQTAAFPFTDDGTAYTKIIVSGDPDHSALIGRFSTTNPTLHMPENGAETADPDALTTLRAWVTAL